MARRDVEKGVVVIHDPAVSEKVRFALRFHQFRHLRRRLVVRAVLFQQLVDVFRRGRIRARLFRLVGLEQQIEHDAPQDRQDRDHNDLPHKIRDHKRHPDENQQITADDIQFFRFRHTFSPFTLLLMEGLRNHNFIIPRPEQKSKSVHGFVPVSIFS